MRNNFCQNPKNEYEEAYQFMLVEAKKLGFEMV